MKRHRGTQASPTRGIVGVLVGALVLAGAGLVGCGSFTHLAPSASTSTTVGEPSSTTAPPGGPTPRTGGEIAYGIDVNQFDQDIGASHLAQVLQMIHDAGASVVRIGGNWPGAEPSSGTYDWSSIDKIFSLAHSDGLTVLFELGNEPAWDAVGGNEAAPPADCNTPTASCTSVTQFVSALVTHGASEGLQYLIVRNEPQNFDKNWVGGTADAYAHFQQVVYQAAHSADRSIKVLNGGTESVSASLRAMVERIEPPTQYEQEASAFAQSLYTNPAWCDSLDVLDVHVGDHGPLYSPQIVDSSESALEACNGGHRVPVWVTEVGYPSITSLQSANVYQVELDGAYQGGETGQANFLTDTFKALAKDANVEGIDWTFMIDPNITNTVPPGTTYSQAASAGVGDGLAYANYQTKTSYKAFEDIAGANP